MIIDSQPAQKFVENNDDLKILDEPFEEEEYAICLKKGNDEFLDKINGALKAVSYTHLGMGWTSGSDSTVWIFGSGIQPFCRTCDHSGNFDRGVSVYFR